MLDTITEQLRAKYEKDFDTRFLIEVANPIKLVISNAELFKPLTFVATVPLNKAVSDEIYSSECTQVLKAAYIKNRLKEAIDFINNGAQSL